MPLLQISSSCDLCIAHNVHSLNLFALEPPEFVPTSQKFNYPMVSSSDSATHIFLKNPQTNDSHDAPETYHDGIFWGALIF
jgi:hypothetical protein